MTTAIQDRLDLSTEDKTEIEVLRDYIRSDPSDDTILEIIYDSVKAKADRYTKNDFTDDEGEELDIPADIKLWVMQMVMRKYNRRANGIQSEQEDGFGSLTWSDEEIQELQEYRKMEWP